MIELDGSQHLEQVKNEFHVDFPVYLQEEFVLWRPAAGHDVQIFLLGEAVSLMRDPVANAVTPVGWPPLAETLGRTLELGIPIHV